MVEYVNVNITSTTTLSIGSNGRGEGIFVSLKDIPKFRMIIVQSPCGSVELKER